MYDFALVKGEVWHKFILDEKSNLGKDLKRKYTSLTTLVR